MYILIHVHLLYIFTLSLQSEGSPKPQPSSTKRDNGESSGGEEGGRGKRAEKAPKEVPVAMKESADKGEAPVVAKVTKGKRGKKEKGGEAEVVEKEKEEGGKEEEEEGEERVEGETRREEEKWKEVEGFFGLLLQVSGRLSCHGNS